MGYGLVVPGVHTGGLQNLSPVLLRPGQECLRTRQNHRNLKDSSDHLWDCDHVVRKMDATTWCQRCPQSLVFPYCYFLSVYFFLIIHLVCMFLCTSGNVERKMTLHGGRIGPLRTFELSYFSWYELSLGPQKLVAFTNLLDSDYFL